MKIGIACEGGGMLGMYTAGVIDVMLEKGLQKRIDIVVGTSAGALTGLNLVSEQPNRARRMNLKYCHDRRYISLKSWIETGNIINTDFVYHQLPEKLAPIDVQEFEESETLFYVCVTNLRTAKAEYKLITDPIEQADLIRASASLPFVSKPVEWEGERYLDGGLADNIPYALLEEKHCDKIISILTHPYGYVKRDPITKLCEEFYPEETTFVEMVRHRNKDYMRSLNRLNYMESEGQMFVFRPSINLHVQKLEKSRLKMEALYLLGRKDAKKRWAELEEYLAE